MKKIKIKNQLNYCLVLSGKSKLNSVESTRQNSRHTQKKSIQK